MRRLDGYYDRFAKRKGYSLRVALVYTFTYVVLVGVGFLQVRALLENRGESFYLLMAPMSLLVGGVGIFHGVQVIRALRRQKSLNLSVRG